MNQIIAEHWNKEKHELPGFNCIVYPNGVVTVLNCCSLPNSQAKECKYFCYPRCDTTIDNIEKYDASEWTLVDEWVRIEHEGKIFIGGDGTMGNFGFIAHIGSNDDLIWGICFGDSNPIKELAVNDNTLSAVNEHSEVYISVNLSDLTEIIWTDLR
ncbi:hypothetical protein AGMMS49983_13770 [Clostridia bacterium]|nr:hypothetical protein AGMMS49983_13770 [Clostridia bacterium]